jgi:uncharacterized protein with GYD domain
MAKYLFQASYTSEAWAAQLQNPQNRVEILRPIVERLGGRIECAYFAFGESDAVVIFEMPDNVSMAAFALAAAAGGAVKAVKTTPLMTIEEGIEAMRKASGTGYRPPGS